MEQTYYYGDAVLIKKTLNVYQLKDVVYFEYPIEDTILSRTFFIQRICGKPGDSVEIRNKDLYVNDVLVRDTLVVKHNYFIKTKNILLDSSFKVKYGLTEGGKVSDEFDYSYALTEEESERLKMDSAIASVSLKAEKKNTYDETLFPGHDNYKWNMDYYGKIYIPKKNDTLKLDTVSIKLYGTLIHELEKNSLKVSNDSIVINGELTNRYIVKKNYYFVLGDNRDNANDSRIWGYLPENRIIGKVVRTLRKTR